MELREQSYVLSIARHGSIKKAAEELHISPPTLSIFLSNLEQETGVPLFSRMGKRFIPTEAGKLYIQIAEEMVRLSDSYHMRLSDLKNEASGSIHFGIHPRRTLYLLPTAMKEFSSRHPNIQVFTHEDSSSTMFESLLSGDLDFIIINRSHPDPSLVFLPFYRDRLVLVTRADHPLAELASPMPGEPVPWMDLSLLKEETFILPHPPQTTRQAADRAFAAAGFNPKKFHSIENLEAAAQMAAEGLGVSFSFEAYIRNFHYSKPIRYFYVGRPDDTIDYSIVFRKDKYMPAHTHDFISILKKCAQ